MYIIGTAHDSLGKHLVNISEKIDLAYRFDWLNPPEK